MGLFSRDAPHLEHEIYRDLDKLHQKWKGGNPTNVRHLIRDLQDIQDEELQQILSLKKIVRKNVKVASNNQSWGSPRSWGENVQEVEEGLDKIIKAKQLFLDDLKRKQPDSSLDKFMVLAKHLHTLFKNIEKEKSYSTYRRFEEKILDPLRKAVNIAESAIRTAQ